VQLPIIASIHDIHTLLVTVITYNRSWWPSYLHIHRLTRLWKMTWLWLLVNTVMYGGATSAVELFGLQHSYLQPFSRLLS